MIFVFGFCFQNKYSFKFSIYPFGNATRVPNSLDPDDAIRFIGSDHCRNCLQTKVIKRLHKQTKSQVNEWGKEEKKKGLFFEDQAQYSLA